MPLVEIQAVVRRKIDESERRRVKIRQIGVGCLEPEICRGEETAMREYLQYMADHGVDSEALADMTRRLPAWLLGLEDAP